MCLQKSVFTGQTGQANPHISLPLMSQQSGKFMHNKKICLFSLDLGKFSFASFESNTSELAFKKHQGINIKKR